MRDEVMGTVALVGWITLMIAIISIFLIGVTAAAKTAALIGGGMFCASVLYANKEGDNNGRVNR